jgi:paraquat-inducible protein A
MAADDVAGNSTPVDALVTCPFCDLLQREVALAPRASAHCCRCGAELYRKHLDGLDHALAYTLAALALFAVANAFPIVGLEVQGDLVQTTLLGGVRTLFEQHMAPVAALVLLTTFLAPLMQLAVLTYLLLPLKFNRIAPAIGPVFRVLQRAQPWSMVEVFMLGVLVALVKLSRIATVVPGIALWSFAGLMLLLAAASAAFDPRALWQKTDLGR